MRVVAIIQARMGSSRLPGKVLRKVVGRSVLVHVAERARAIPGVHDVAICTTPLPEDDAICNVARGGGLRWVRTQRPLRHQRGKNDVLAAYVEAARLLAATIVVRITSDCPLLDPAVAGEVLRRFCGVGECAYASNVHPPSWFDGCDVEVVRASALARALEGAGDDEREHVTTHLWRRPEVYRVVNVARPDGVDGSDVKLSIDTAEDLLRVERVVRRLASPTAWGWRETLAAYELTHPSPLLSRAVALYTAKAATDPLRRAYMLGVRAGAVAAEALARRRAALADADLPIRPEVRPINPYSASHGAGHAAGSATAWELGWEDGLTPGLAARLGLVAAMTTSTEEVRP